MCPRHRPAHLLLLHKAFAQYLIHSRLGEAGRNWLTVSKPIAVVDNGKLVHLNVTIKFGQLGGELITGVVVSGP